MEIEPQRSSYDTRMYDRFQQMPITYYVQTYIYFERGNLKFGRQLATADRTIEGGGGKVFSPYLLENVLRVRPHVSPRVIRIPISGNIRVHYFNCKYSRYMYVCICTRVRGAGRRLNSCYPSLFSLISFRKFEPHQRIMAHYT